MTWFNIIKSNNISKDDIFRELGIEAPSVNSVNTYERDEQWDGPFNFRYFEWAVKEYNFLHWNNTQTERTLSALNFMAGIPNVQWATTNGTNVLTSISGQVRVGNVNVITPTLPINELGALITSGETCDDTIVEKNGIRIKICIQPKGMRHSSTIPWGDFLGMLALTYHNKGGSGNTQVEELVWLMSIALKEDGSWETLKRILGVRFVTDNNWKQLRRRLSEEMGEEE